VAKIADMMLGEGLLQLLLYDEILVRTDEYVVAVYFETNNNEYNLFIKL
jgi:hypothetical protein